MSESADLVVMDRASATELVIMGRVVAPYGVFGWLKVLPDTEEFDGLLDYTIDGSAYKGFTQLLGLEARQDIGESWDVGLHAGMLHAIGAGARDYHLGVSVGLKVSPNAWLSLGYNQLGFVDADFAGAEYRARGLYLNLRVKFDQDTFNLNGRDSSQSLNVPAKP